jgi:hypothetical protein
MLSLGVEDKYLMHESFKLSWSGPVLHVAMQPLYVSHGAIRLPLFNIAFRGAGSIRLTLLLILLGVLVGVSVAEGRLLSQGILVGDGKHLLKRPGVFHGELLDQG